MLFISHSTKDKAAALDLQTRLRQRGYACEQQFLDSDERSGIRLGEKWEQVIYNNLRDCRALLVLCSPRWLESKWCFAELAAAKMSGKEICPLVIDECDRSSLGEYQAVFLNQADPAAREPAFDRLFANLEKRGLGPKENLPWPHPDLKTADGKPDRCPFPGLLAFDERYAAVYFGREPETQVVLEQLRKMSSQGEPRLLMIVGGSGSGKSSLLRAGVLPRLRHETEAGNWLVLPTLRYGASPSDESTVFDQLARDLAGLFPADARNSPDWKSLRTQLAGDDVDRAARTFFETTQDLTYARQCPDATVLLPLDQFEELLAHGAGPAAQKFLRFLQAAFRQRNGRLLAVGTMRSDYLDLYERHPHALVAPVFQPWRLGPFPPDRIGDIIHRPAARAHVEISDDLQKQLENDTPTAEALPLLAFTLEKLYRRHAGDGKLELGEYRELGGMEGAIQKSVERVIPQDSLTRELASALRLSFVKHLAQVNEKDEVIRRLARWRDLPAEAQPLLDKLVNERLLVKSENEGEVSVEVAHEAMFRCWTELKEWLRTAGDILRWRRDVERDQRQDGSRWTGLRAAQLAVARDWPQQRDNELHPNEIAWIQDALRQERKRKRIVAGVMVTVAGLAGLFLWQKVEADRATAQAIVKEKEANNNLAEANFALGRIPFDKGDQDAAVLWWVKALATAEEDSLQSSLRNLIGAWSPRERRLLHDDAVVCAAFSPDGQTLVTGSRDNTARLWNAQTGAAKGELLQHKGDANVVVNFVGSVAFSSDGQTLVTGSGDRTARLWDAQTGAAKGAPLQHQGSVESVAFSPDGKTVLTGSGDSTARLWDAQTGAAKGAPLPHQGFVKSVAFSPDGKTVLTGSFDSTAQLWDAQTGAAKGAPLQHQGFVNSVAFSPNGQTVLTGSDDKTAWLWDAQTGAAKGALLQHQGSVNSVAFSPDGRTVVTGSNDRTARLWDAQTGAAKGAPLQHQGSVNSVAFSPDGQTVLTGSDDKTARLWDMPTSAAKGALLQHGDRSYSAAFSPDGQTIVTVSDDNTARLWDARSGDSKSEPLRHDAAVYFAAFSPDGQTVVTGSDDNIAHLWDARTGTAKGEPLRYADAGYALAFSPDGQTIVTSSSDHRARLWDAHTGAAKGEPLRHQQNVSSVAFSLDGQIVVTGSFDGTARLWDVKTGAAKGEPLPHGDSVLCVAISPDGQTVVTGSRDKTARLWEARTGAKKGEPLGHDGPVLSVAYSPDGQTVLTGSEDTTARFWDAHTGAAKGEPLRHEGPVLSVAYSPDGQTVLTGSEDTTARFWDARTGTAKGDRLRHYLPVSSVSFCPDSQMVVTISGNNAARLWAVPPPAIVDRDSLDRLRLSVEVRTGKRLGDNGVVQWLTYDEWNTRRLKLEKLGGPCDQPTWEEYKAWKQERDARRAKLGQ